MDETFISFIKKLENRIIECINNDTNHFDIDLKNILIKTMFKKQNTKYFYYEKIFKTGF